MRDANLNVRVAHAPGAIDECATVECWFDDLEGRIEAVLSSADGCCLAVAWFKSKRLMSALPGGRARVIVQSEKHVRPLPGVQCRKIGLAKGGSDRPLMHNKFLIVKDAEGSTTALLTGSYNYTATASRSLENVVCIRNAPKVFAAYEKEFEALWRMGRRVTAPRARARGPR